MNGLFVGIYHFSDDLKEMMKKNPMMGMYKWFFEVDYLAFDTSVTERILSSSLRLYFKDDADLDEMENMMKSYMEMSSAMYYSSSPKLQEMMKETKFETDEDKRIMTMSSKADLDELMKVVKSFVGMYAQMFISMKSQEQSWK